MGVEGRVYSSGKRANAFMTLPFMPFNPSLGYKDWRERESEPSKERDKVWCTQNSSCYPRQRLV